MRNRLVTAFLAVCIACLAYGAGSLASLEKLRVADPLAATAALAQVIVLDAEHVKAQEYPKVIIAQPDTSLEEYMADEGYAELEDERMGSIRVFETEPGGDFLNYVEHTVNEYYSLWVWRE